MTLQIGEVDIKTGEIMYRDMTADEIAKHKADLQAESERLIEVEKTKIESELKKQALLDKLGITEEEAKLLLSQKGM